MKTVYAIFNPYQWEVMSVVRECAEDEIELNVLDGYVDGWFEAMRNSDEVWLFGDCKLIPAAMIAKQIGMDIWQMG